jgi:hypothetical protein
LQLGVVGLDRQETRQLTVYQPFAIIGWKTKPAPSERRAHVRPWAYLQTLDGNVFYVDLQSREETADGGPALQADWLARLQPARVGHFTVSLSGPDQDEADDKGLTSPGWNPLIPCARQDDLLPHASLELVNRKIKGPPGPISRVVTLVGQSAACGLRLVGSSVADFHCSLVRTPLGIWIVDLLGGATVAVNGKPVRWAKLEESDLFQVGLFLFRIHYHREPNSPPDLTDPGRSLLGHLVEEFRHTHEHMAHRFQECALLMHHMFSTMRQEQASSVRGDVDQLQQFIQDLHSIPK